MARDSQLAYPDIYFEPSYAKLYEGNGSEAVEYRFESEYGLVSNLFMKRIVDVPGIGQSNYYDIVTPYGYGGPIIHWTTDREKLIAAYMDDFSRYTAKNNIVAEFVRFHPLLGNGVDFQAAYNATYDRKTVGTNLTYEDVIGTEFSKKKRKIIRKLLDNPDIRFAIEENPESLDDFIEVYYSTMDRDGADDYYYFDNRYFDSLASTMNSSLLTCKVFLKDKLIAMGIYFRYGKYLHAHLSGTLSDYLEYSPAYILKYALAVYGHAQGYEYIHYGGGSSRDEDNGLYQFKKEFGKNTTFDFYIAKKVWNPEKYRQICEAAGADIHSEFFPAYRVTK